ncbi:hypothetical protein AB9P05_21955 [Roseivirga sp. BDSF3-8]|uniref:hypothetical protein n=1 Tax=Roseivirga sp. BDSF3-8 TaxID=3241598 RepID=UPI003532597A
MSRKPNRLRLFYRASGVLFSRGIMMVGTIFSALGDAYFWLFLSSMVAGYKGLCI